jgi:hypothetical protein
MEAFVRTTPVTVRCRKTAEQGRRRAEQYVTSDPRAAEPQVERPTPVSADPGYNKAGFGWLSRKEAQGLRLRRQSVERP